MNNEVTALESQRSSGGSPSMDGSSEESSPMDFDAWVEDNFVLTKEGDGFPSFTGDVEAFNNLATLEDAESNLEKLTAYSQSREEVPLPPPLLEGEESAHTGAKDENLKVAPHKRKKSSYIP